MVVEIILGIVAGLGLGYLGQKIFLIYQKSQAINKARVRIEKQDIKFMMDGKEYDLKGKINPQSKSSPVKEVPIPKPKKDKRILNNKEIKTLYNKGKPLIKSKELYARVKKKKGRTKK